MSSYYTVLFLWLLKRLFETIFSNVSVDNVLNNFSINTNHYIVFFINTLIFIPVVLINFKIILKHIASFYLSRLCVYYLLITATILWSEDAILTIAGVYYLTINLIFAILFGNSFINKKDSSLSISLFIKCWFWIIFFEAIFSLFVYPDHFPFIVLDEKALISLILFGISINKYGLKPHNLIFLFFGFIGKSFSALVSGFIYLILEMYKKNIILLGIILVTAFVFSFKIYDLVYNGDLTFYEKSAEHFMTGSGRFQVWEIITDSIINGTIFQTLFGHGFMTERLELVRSDALWGVDVHNSVLQITYGCGLIGLVYMLYVFSLPFTCMNANLDSKSRDSLNHVNITLFIFGLTASSFLSRPSISTIFFISYLILITNITRQYE